ncbi:MAG: GTP cyclohydrolase I FolE [Planctomycetes bacterium]|nr:GTP cyclohydrolase I FolE [Planctomycetota bacterium]
MNPENRHMAMTIRDMETNPHVDQRRIEDAVREILLAVGEDPDREGLRRTPQRVARMYAELFAGLHQDPVDVLEAAFSEEYDELVVLRDIPFNSMCEHHLMPFEGKAHLAYLPKGKVVGISKLARVVDAFAHRPQVQERLTSQIADILMSSLEAKGVAVLISATHTCMTCRGVRKPGSIMVTSAVRGLCKSDPRTRGEVMSLLQG